MGTDKISETVNDLDSDGSNFSAFSDSDTCEVSSPFSSSSGSSEGEEGVQPESGRGRKRKRRALPKCATTDLELGWKKKTNSDGSALFGVPGINKNLNISQDNSPWDVFEIFFSPELFTLIQSETNRYAMQQINQKKQEGSLKLKFVFAQWDTVSFQEIKKFFSIVVHMSVLGKSSLRALLDFASGYSHPICSFCWNVSG